MKQPRVLLADDHTFFLELFSLLLEPHYDVVGAVTDGRALIAKALDAEPDVIVLDITMPDLDGLEAAVQIKKRLPEVKLIVLTAHREPSYLSRALNAGANGFLLKSSSSLEIFDAIDQVMAGKIYITQEAELGARSHEDNRAKNQPDGLTARQLEVLQLLAEGLSMKEVAGRLNLSPRTIAFHKYKIMETLKIDTNAKLIRYAIKHGMTST